MEAQSQGLACVATRLPGIAELIEDGATGVLVPPGDPRALAEALAALIRDPARRARLAAAGEARVRRDFDMRRGIDRSGGAVRASGRGLDLGRRVNDRSRCMRVAFYAPLKPPDHPVPSGDRRVARPPARCLAPGRASAVCRLAAAQL